MVKQLSFGELLEQASNAIAASMTERPDPWWLLSVLPKNEDNGYVGKRCGWYPEKPRRIRPSQR